MIMFSGVGRLTRDPSLRKLDNTCVVDFSVAVNENVGKGEKRKEITSFFDCVAWDSAAELINKYTKKGEKLYVSGVLRQEKWQDRTTGDTRSKVVLRVNHFEFLTPKYDSQGVDNNNVSSDGGTEDVPF